MSESISAVTQYNVMKTSGNESVSAVVGYKESPAPPTPPSTASTTSTTSTTQFPWWLLLVAVLLIIFSRKK